MLAFEILGIYSPSCAEARTGDYENHPYFTENIQISAGVFFPSFNTDIKVDGDSGRVGTLMDMENLLGLDDSITTPAPDILWRINRKHRLGFSYFNLNRDGTKNLSRTINFGDRTYVIGTNVESSLDISVYRMRYGYSIVNDGRKEFGLGLAVDFMPIEASIRSARLAKEKENALLIVPTLGFHAAFAISKKLAIIGNFNGIYFDFDTYGGSVLNSVAVLEYNTFKNLSVGAGYSYYHADIEADYSGFDGNLNFEYHGPLVYIKFLF
jgi:hypothetical protein